MKIYINTFFKKIGPKDSAQIGIDVISRIKFASCQWAAPQQGLVLLFEDWQPVCCVHKRNGWHRQSLSRGSELWRNITAKSRGNDFKYSHKSKDKIKYQLRQQRKWSWYASHHSGQGRRTHPWIRHEDSPSSSNRLQRQVFCFQSGLLLQCVKHTVQFVLDTSMKEMKTLAFCSVISICSNFVYRLLLGKLYEESTVILWYFCSLNVTALGMVLKCF